MLENQAADSHISAVGTEQTAGGSQTEAVGEQTGSEGDSHITNEAAEKAFDREMNALWGLESPIAAAEAPDSGEYEAKTAQDEASQGYESPAEAESQAEAESEAESESEAEAEGEAESEAEGEAESEEEAEGEIEEETSGATDATMTLNYLGRQVDIPLDQVKDLAERGMNLDRLRCQYDKLKPLEPLLEAVETTALFYDVPVADFIRGMSSLEGLRNDEVQRLVAQGSTEEAALEVFNSKLAVAQAKREQGNPANGSQRGLSREQKEQIVAFQRFRPEVDQQIKAGRTMPDQVIKDWHNGASLTEAWLLYEGREAEKAQKSLQKELETVKKEHAKLTKDLKNLKKNTENKHKAPSSKKGAGGGSGHPDPFSGWDKF